MLAGCGGAESICDADGLKDALAAGGTVEVGGCEISGSFTVPAGSTLRGIDATSAIRGNLDLAADTRLESLRVIASDGVAVSSAGGVIANVQIETTGIGIGVEDGTIELTNVVVDGKDIAKYDVVLVRTTATIDNLQTTKAMEAGAVLAASNFTWTGGSATDNRALGILVEGGQGTLDNVEVSLTRQGARLRPAFGAVFTDEADVSSEGLRLSENEGYGLLHHTGTGAHLNVEARDNGDTAVWVQQADGLEVTGTIVDNMFAGVVVVDSDAVNLHDATIDRTIQALRLLEETGAVEVGDGIHLVRSNATLRDLTLSDNERAGILVELDGGTLDPNVFDRITVTAIDGSHGVIVQNGTTPQGWDDGITRLGVTAQADGQITLPSVEVVGPCERPASSGAQDGIDNLL